MGNSQTSSNIEWYDKSVLTPGTCRLIAERDNARAWARRMMRERDEARAENEWWYDNSAVDALIACLNEIIQVNWPRRLGALLRLSPYLRARIIVPGEKQDA